MEPFTEKELKEIFQLIYDKVRSLQINNAFDKALKKELSKNCFGMSDDYFFKQMCDLIFQSRLRGQIWLRFEPEIRKEFSDYKPDKVAKYKPKDVERMLHNPKMIRHKGKIKACIHNAKVIVDLSEKYNGFWKFLYKHEIEDLVEKLKSKMKWMGDAIAYGFLRYVGMEVVKPDSNVRRLLFRLGLTESEAPTPQTYKRIQEVGRSMAEANNVEMPVIDYTLYMFGAGEKPFVKYAVCSKVPKCKMCELVKYCKYPGTYLI